jgi:glyoxylase-like metal-dependent hydrolase (beta-lactamase superfamily II)
VIVDPGSDDPDEIDRLIRVVLRQSFEGSSPRAVVLTHHHQDHVSGAAEVARRLDLPVRAHPVVLERAADVLGHVRVEPIEDGDVLDLGNLTLRAVLTEGHARGHLAFHAVEPNVLISGDLVSALATMLIEPDDGDMTTYLESLERAAALGVTMALPSHGPPVLPRAFAKTAEHRLDRERKVMRAIEDGGRGIEDIAAVAYADTPGAPAFLAQRQTLAHLVRLVESGQVRSTADDRFEPA